MSTPSTHHLNDSDYFPPSADVVDAALGHRALRTGPYDSGQLSGPSALVTSDALERPSPDGEVGHLLMALLGWDAALVELAESTHPRAPRIMGSLLSWLLA